MRNCTISDQDQVRTKKHKNIRSTASHGDQPSCKYRNQWIRASSGHGDLPFQVFDSVSKNAAERSSNSRSGEENGDTFGLHLTRVPE